jgi:hypothetical protein
MNDIEKAIETQQKLITNWEQRIQELEEVIKKYPWGRNGLKYDFGDWRESELLKRKEQIELALITLSALEKQIPKKVNEITIIQQYKAVLDGYCPSCQRYLTNSMRYCTDCGQLLDWEVEE